MDADTTSSTTKPKLTWMLISCLAVLAFVILTIVSCKPRSYPRESAVGMTKEQLLAEFGEPDRKYYGKSGEDWSYDPDFFNTGSIVRFDDKTGIATEVIEDFSF